MSAKYYRIVPFLTLLALSTTGYAEEEDYLDYDEIDEIVASVEEIIVTANRRQEMLQDVPLSIAAFTENFFKDTGLTDFKSLEQYAASLKIAPGNNSRSTSIRIRGIGSTGTNAGIDPSVGVFIDGIYQGRAGMSIGDFLDIERVEVLRGPQGTLYGKNTSAGAISVISKQPTYHFDAAAQIVAANYNTREFRGMVNIPIGEQGSAVRTSGYVLKRDGWDDNVFYDEEINDADKWGIKSRALLETETFGSFLLTIDASKEDAVCCSADIITYDGPSMLGVPFSDLRTAGILDENGNPITLPADDPFDQKHSFNEDFRNRVKVSGVAFEWTLHTDSDYVITALNAVRNYESDNEHDGDFSPFKAVAATTSVDLEQVSSEFRVASPEGEILDYQVGAYYYHSNMNTVDSFEMFPALVDRLIGGALAPFTSTGNFSNVGDNRHRTTTYALFGQTTWNITDEYNATMGLRYTSEKKERVGTQKTFPEYPAFLPDNPPVLGGDLESDEEFTKTNLSPAISIRYQPRFKMMYYASISRGFKSGGFNQLRTLGDYDIDNDGVNDIEGEGTGVGTEFDDEISTNYELGWKGTWMDGRLQWNGTFYYVDYKDFQAQTFDGTSISVRNAGSLKSRGLELEIQYVHSLELNMGGSLGYNKAEYTEFKGGECTVLEAEARMLELQAEGVAILAPGQANCTKSLRGEQLDSSPELTLSSYIHYSKPLAFNNEYKWSARFEYIHMDSYFLAQDLDPNLKSDTTDMFNARLGLSDIDERWDVVLWVRNLTDENYLLAGFDVPTLSGYTSIMAPPRTFGISFDYRYE